MSKYEDKVEAPLVDFPPSKELEPWQEVLKGAIDILEHYDWGQGSFVQGPLNMPRYCMAGAIMNAAGTYEAKNKANYRVRMVLPKTGAQWDEIVAWNDTPGRTKGEVVAMLKKVMNDG